MKKHICFHLAFLQGVGLCPIPFDEYGEDYFCKMMLNVIICRYTQVFYEIAGDFDKFNSHNQIKLLRQIQTTGCDELADMVVDVCKLHTCDGAPLASDILQIEAYVQARKNIMQRAVLHASLEHIGVMGRARKI